METVAARFDCFTLVPKTTFINLLGDQRKNSTHDQR